MKIAVIDDESGMRHLIRDRLKLDGHEIIEAENGKLGLDLIISRSPDLIISDIRMPEMNGEEMFYTLRNTSPEHDFIPFIFLSGEADEKEQIKHLNNGADACFEKPINIQLLAAHVNSHLSRVSRVTDYFKRKLDSIAETLPQKIASNFSGYQSLIEITEYYVNAIIDVMYDHFDQTIPDSSNSINEEQKPLDQKIKYIQFCLDRFKERRDLVNTANGEDLSWTLIFQVGLAQLKRENTYVSDLYVSIPSAKSTIHSRIDSLIDEGILTKSTDSNDGRRQQLSLSDNFSRAFQQHLDTSITLMHELSEIN